MKELEIFFRLWLLLLYLIAYIELFSNDDLNIKNIYIIHLFLQILR